MKKYTSFLAFAIIVLFAACSKARISGYGKIVTEQRSVSNFSKVKLFGANNVSITKGTDFSVAVKGYGNLLPYFETTIADKTLELRYKNDVKVEKDNIEIIITMPAIAALETFGSGNITAFGNFGNSTFLELSTYGSGYINIQQSNVQKCIANIAGSGNINAFGITAGSAEITIKGSADASITVTEQLTAKILGSGNIYYSGNAAVNTQISGSGNVVKQ